LHLRGVDIFFMLDFHLKQTALVCLMLVLLMFCGFVVWLSVALISATRVVHTFVCHSFIIIIIIYQS